VNVIPTDPPGVFVVVALTVRPENQQAIIDTVRSAGDPTTVPGLVSINLLRSLDGTQVINHMHWASRDAYEEAGGQLPAIKNTREQVLRLIEDHSTNIYEAVDLGAPSCPRTTRPEDD